MSLVLARLGRFAYSHPKRVLLAWLIAVGAVVALLATQPTSMSTGLTLNDTPSQRVLDTITAEIPQARGTQGSLVFTAEDGGRVDTPQRSAAIAAALTAAQDTGYVVDREARLDERRRQVTAMITTQVEQKVSAELGPQLKTMSAMLAAEAARLKDSPAAADPAVQAQKVRMGAQLATFADRAQNLSVAAPSDQALGASALIGEIKALQERTARMPVPAGVTLPQLPANLTDPRVKVDQAVTAASAPVFADLDRLTLGTDPKGTPLHAGDRTYRTVLVSADGTTAVVSLQLTGQVSDLPGSALDDVLAAARDAARPAGLTMSASSSLLPVSPPLGGHEAIGLLVSVIVLLLTLGSLVAAGLPVLTALVGVFIGIGGAFAFSAHYQMTTATPALGLMIGLAVGIDYALFIVHKHRSLIISSGLPAREAVGRATGTAGSAVLFAGVTVVIALLGLLTLGIAFVNTMALTAATTVTLAVVIALTALPALLGLVGERIAAPKARTPRPNRHRVARRWMSIVTARPVLVLVGLTGLLAVAAIPATGLRLGMPSGAVAEAGSPQRTAYDAISRGFGEGANAPLVVTARQTSGQAFDQAGLLSAQRELAKVDGVTGVALMGSSPRGELAIFQVTPASGPTDAPTQDLVHRLRSAQVANLGPLGVTGLTAMNIDLSDTLAGSIPVYVGIVVALSLVVLLLVFRSLLIPVASTAGFLLTMGATAGLVTTVFSNPDWTWMVGVDRPGPILSFLPIMATGILYGLANDYQVFLGSSVREDHIHGTDAREAVRTGFFHAGRVVVAAAIIMVSVFGGFVLGTDTTIRQFGFALSAGILIDAFLIRMTLMPALLHLAGERAWWLPGWLDAVLPSIDIEGEQLRRAQEPVAPAPAPADVGSPVA